MSCLCSMVLLMNFYTFEKLWPLLQLVIDFFSSDRGSSPTLTWRIGSGKALA